MTQAELDLAQLGMTIARLQLKANASVLIGIVGAAETIKQLCELEREFIALCDKIQTGEYRGSDSGTA